MNLYAHQSEGRDRLLKNPRYFIAGEPGVGKTMMVLAAIAADPIPTLVLAPKSVIRAAWAQDAKHFPGLRVFIHHGPRRHQRNDYTWRDADVVVTNYDTFRSDAKMFAESKRFRRLVVDESSMIRNPDSARSKYVRRFSQLVEQCWCLSGTPAPNGPQGWWAQLDCIGHTESLPFFKWCHRWAHAVKKQVRGKAFVDRWILRDPVAFAAMLEPKVWSLRKQDCLDLPSQTDIVREVELSEVETKAYALCEDELRVLAKGAGVAGDMLDAALDLVEPMGIKGFQFGSKTYTRDDADSVRVHAEAVLTKLRQIVGGAVILEGSPNEIGRSKLGELDALLDELGPEEPVVIWAWYRNEIDRIAAMLETRGEQSSILDGRTSKDAEWIVSDFQAGKCKRIVCHPQAAGHGITLTAAAHAVWYGLGFDLELYEQARNRIHRISQERKVTHWHLVAPGTVDERMLKALRSKSRSSEAVKEWLAELAGVGAGA